jgi:multicomponent Na+:H+ antiporter subunit G
MHAATKPVTLGLLLITTGAALQTTDTGDIVKLVLAAILQLLTAPLGMHLLGRAAHSAGLIDPATTIDDYASDNRALGPPDR